MNEKSNKMKWLKVILVILVFYPWVGGVVSYLYTYYSEPIMEMKNAKAQVVYSLTTTKGGGQGLVFIIKDFPIKNDSSRFIIGFDDKYFEYFKDKKYYNIDVKYKINNYNYLQASYRLAILEIKGEDDFFNYKMKVSEVFSRLCFNAFFVFFLVYLVFLLRKNNYFR